MNGKILVPLDGSELAEKAVPLAVAVASRSGLPVELLHVHFPVPALWSTGIPAESYRWEFETREAADAYLAQATERISEALNERVTAGVRTGDVADELVAALGEEVGVVVMTTQGQSGLRGVLLGSIARKVVHDARIPVLLLGPGVEGWANADAVRIENVMVALDASAPSDAILEPALDIARWFGARVHLVGVVPVGVGFGYPSVPHGAVLEGGATEERLVQHLEQKRSEVQALGLAVTHRVLRDDDVAGALLRAARESAADLIAMSTHARGPALRVLLGSVASGVLKESPVPVLMLRPEKFE
jgi:nucleotide-binding universal stress UspA family protein